MREALGKNQLQSIYARLARRYDLQHLVLTGGADRRGRTILVERTVTGGERILDCGAGTGSTGLLAAEKVGPKGHVSLLDWSGSMLSVAAEKARQQRLLARISCQVGDMTCLPYPADSFDLVFSSYSLCPLADPKTGALELYRVCRPGGKIAVAHSVEPRTAMVRWVAERIEDLAWRLPSLSMGCRSVSVLASLLETGATLLFQRRIGVPLWPFLIFIVKKPVLTRPSSTP